MTDAERFWWTHEGDEYGYVAGSCSYTKSESAKWGKLARAAYAVAAVWDNADERAKKAAAFYALKARE